MSHDGFELYVRSPQEIAETHLCIAQNDLESFLAPEFPQATCRRILRSGDAAEEIVDVARTEDIDLIVMPTHAGQFRRLVLGSTTAKVLGAGSLPRIDDQARRNDRSGTTRASSMGLRRQPNLRLGKSSCFC